MVKFLFLTHILLASALTDFDLSGSPLYRDAIILETFKLLINQSNKQHI